MATTADYNLRYMLPGVLSASFDALGCRSCRRQTHDPVVGHDGFCPVPALYLLVERSRRYVLIVDGIPYGIYKTEEEIEKDEKRFKAMQIPPTLARCTLLDI